MSGGLRGKKAIYYVYKSGFVFSSTRVSHQICQPQPSIWSGIVSWSPSAIAVCSVKLALFSFISSVTSFLPLVVLCCWWGVLEQALLNEVVMLFSSYSPLIFPFLLTVYYCYHNITYEYLLHGSMECLFLIGWVLWSNIRCEMTA